MLGLVARQLYNERRARDEILNSPLLNEAALDLLLDLHACSAAGEKVCVTSACAAACVPTTTAHRMISKLEQSGNLARETKKVDKRVRYLVLTSEAEKMMSDFLGSVAANRLSSGGAAAQKAPPV
jgi:DNA-binding MarR family transcriptional regulator